MKKILFAVGLFISTNTFSQNCNLAIKDGDKSTLNVSVFTNLLIGDPKFMRLTDAEKDAEVAEFNARIPAGTKLPASKSAMVFKIKKVSGKDGDEYTFTTNIAGNDYSGYVVCSNDTLYIARNRGPVMVGYEASPLGYTIQGVQIVPMNLKVGDVLPIYDDIGITFPKNTDLKVKQRVFSHNETSSTDGFGFATDSRTGESFLGPYTKTSTIAIYKTIDVKVRQKLSHSSHTVHFSKVTGEEEVTVNGVKYKAFIIEGESWTKSKMEVSYESANEEVNKQQQEFAEKLEAKNQKFMIRKGFTNRHGYVVMPSTT
ncbi:MAG: hypothetical protein NTY88_00850 [Bacteroidetes bacterium]|nr:hypothetical protein [Bacteroidota bacterium]